MAILGDRLVGGLGVTELLDRSVAARRPRPARRGALADPPLRSRRRGDGLRRSPSTSRRSRPQPRMVIFGAIDFSAEMAKLASEIGYGVTICDAREPFVNSPRFSRARGGRRRLARPVLEGQELGPRDVVLVFTHDPKFDEPALIGALAHRRRLHRRARQPPHPGKTGRAAARRRPRRGGDRQDPRAVRARHRRPHPARDRRLDPRRGDRGAHRPGRREPAGDERPDPCRGRLVATPDGCLTESPVV